MRKSIAAACLPAIVSIYKLTTYANFFTNTKSLQRMDLNDDLMCGDDGDVLEDTFGDEIDNHQPFPDGEYTIKSKQFTNLVLDLSENINGGYIHSYKYNCGDNQTWLLNYDSDKEAYKITSKQNSNLFLCYIASNDNILRVHTNNDSKNHYWRIEQTPDGYFRFQNLGNIHIIITVQDILTSLGGKQVIVDAECSFEKENSQKWILNPVYFKTVPDGDYNIFNCNLSDIVVGLSNEQNSLAHAQNYSVNESQEWKFSYDCDKEAYKIKSALNSDVLTWNNNAASEEPVIEACKDSGNQNQCWRIERTEDGFYRLRNLKHLSFILILNAASSESSESGLQLSVHNDSGDDDNIYSTWIVKPVSYQSIPDGDYNIFNRNLPDIVIDFSKQEGSLVHGHSYRGNDTETWSLVYNRDKKAYKIKTAGSDLLLCWNSKASSKEILLRAYTENNCKNQYWRIEKINDGSYRVRNLDNTEKLITVIDKDSAYGGKELIVTDSKELRNSGDDEIISSSNWLLQQIGRATIPNGKFKIATKSNYRKVINLNQESKLFIIDNVNLITSEWKIQYDTTKRAYKIYSSRQENLGWVYQNKNSSVTLDNINGPDGEHLRNYWMIEYRIQAGGYLIRSLCDPSQAVSFSNNDLVITDKATYAGNQLFNFIRN